MAAELQAARQRMQLLAPEALRDPLCLICPQLAPPDYPLELEPLWLHCHAYSCSEWSFTCPPPDWAAAEYQPAAS